MDIMRAIYLSQDLTSKIDWWCVPDENFLAYCEDLSLCAKNIAQDPELEELGGLPGQGDKVKARLRTRIDSILPHEELKEKAIA